MKCIIYAIKKKGFVSFSCKKLLQIRNLLKFRVAVPLLAILHTATLLKNGGKQKRNKIENLLSCRKPKCLKICNSMIKKSTKPVNAQDSFLSESVKF